MNCELWSSYIQYTHKRVHVMSVLCNNLKSHGNKMVSIPIHNNFCLIWVIRFHFHFHFTCSLTIDIWHLNLTTQLMSFFTLNIQISISYLELTWIPIHLLAINTLWSLNMKPRCGNFNGKQLSINRVFFFLIKLSIHVNVILTTRE